MCRKRLRIVIILIIPCLLGAIFNLRGQTNISFNKDGKLAGEIPAIIGETRTFNFSVDDSQESLKKVLAEFDEKCRKAKAWLEDSISKNPVNKKKYMDTYGIDVDKILANFDRNIFKIRTAISDYQSDKSVSINSGYLHFHSSENKYVGTLSINQPSGSQLLEFKVNKEDAYKKTIFNQYSSTISLAQSIEFQQIRKFYDQFKQLIKEDSAQKAQPLKNSERIESRKIIKQKLTLMQDKINLFISDFKGNAAWFEEWLWYTGGVPKLNPFDFIDPAIIVLPDTTDLSILKAMISARSKMIAELKPTDKGYLTIIDTLIAAQKRLSDKLYEGTSRYKKYLAMIQSNQGKIDDFRSYSEIMNRVKLYGSKSGKDDPWTFTRNHDASDGYSLMSNPVKDEYLESNSVVIINHNIPGNHQVNIFYRSAVVTNDMPEWEGIFIDAVGKIQALKKDLPAVNLQGHNLIKRNMVDTFNADNLEYARINASISALIEILKEKIKILQTIELQSNPYKGIKAKEPDSSKYYSKVYNTPKKSKGARIFYYSFKDELDKKDLAPVDTFSYRINKLYRILPTAGFVYTPWPGFVNLTLNSAGTQPESRDIVHPVNFVAGLKFHIIRPLDIRSPKIFWGKDENQRCLFASRLSLIGMFNVLNPLADQFAGIGLDLIPGLCITAGAHFNYYDYYDFSGGTSTTKKMYRTGLYVGLLTDVSVVAEIIKLIGISK